jgi:hypothetical protein
VHLVGFLLEEYITMHAKGYDSGLVKLPTQTRHTNGRPCDIPVQKAEERKKEF